MSNNKERLAHYLSGEMTEPERRKLEQELAQDDQLATDLAQLKQRWESVVVEHMVETDLRKKMAEWEKQRAPGGSEQDEPAVEAMQVSLRKSLPWRTILTWSAIAAGLLLLPWLLFFRGEDYLPPPTTEEIPAVVASFYLLPDLPGNTLGTTAEIWQSARDAYGDGDFSAVISALDTVANRSPEMDYYLAHSYYQLGDFDRSSDLFDQLASSTSIYNYRAEWFAILSGLQASATDPVIRSRLTTLTRDPNHPYHDPARTLQARIDAGQADN